jgi:hypothetical protein
MSLPNYAVRVLVIFIIFAVHCQVPGADGLVESTVIVILSLVTPKVAER